MQLDISNLDRLAKGGMPTITVTGPMAAIVQFMQSAGNISVAGTNGSIPASVASPVPVPAAGASLGPTVASSGNSGTVSATGTQSGSMAQMGSALSNAVSAAANATSLPSRSTSGSATGSPSTASSMASTTSSAANAPAIAVPNTQLQASTSAVPAATTKTIPVGTTGQVVVLGNLPNAPALTTAVQNQVHAATIQTQTTISATLNSIPSLNAISLANSIRAQVSGGG
jgi:hypothetical protein